jgi:DNA gyrase subunit A
MSLSKKDKIVGMVVAGEGEKYIFTASEKGQGKKTAVELYPRHRRGGKGVINLKINPKIGKAIGMIGVSDEQLICITEMGKVIRIKSELVRPLGRATQGVKLINLEKGDRAVSIAKVRES